MRPYRLAAFLVCIGSALVSFIAPYEAASAPAAAFHAVLTVVYVLHIPKPDAITAAECVVVQLVVVAMYAVSMPTIWRYLYFPIVAAILGVSLTARQGHIFDILEAM
jgi:hypothetical protein